MAQGLFRNNVVAVTGPRGSGKSLYLAFLIIEMLRQGRTVWSNMPVHITRYLAKQYGVSSSLKAEMLDLNMVYSLDESLTNGVIAIDEANVIGESRNSMSIRNRLVNAMIQQIRKRGLDFFYTVQDFWWMDSRLRFATDVLVKCMDMKFLPWGVRNGIGDGELFNLEYYDMSGFKTGKRMRKYKKTRFNAKPYWKTYDTRQVVDLEEIITKIKVNYNERVIGGEPDDGGSYSPDVFELVVDKYLEQNNNPKVIEKSELIRYGNLAIGRALNPYDARKIDLIMIGRGYNAGRKQFICL